MCMLCVNERIIQPHVYSFSYKNDIDPFLASYLYPDHPPKLTAVEKKVNCKRLHNNEYL